MLPIAIAPANHIVLDALRVASNIAPATLGTSPAAIAADPLFKPKNLC